MKNILSYNKFNLSERTQTISDANQVLKLVKDNISKNATLIGGFGKGKKTSEHDIDILIPDVEFNDDLKSKLFNLLNAKSCEDTDWGGFYYETDEFGDVDFFYTTDDFDY